MSDIPFGITLIIRNIATIIVQFFFIVSVMLLITLTMGIPFGFNPLHLVILLVSLFEVYGLGLIMGGIALLFKNVSSVIGALQFFFMPLAFASIQEPWLWLFPITPGADSCGGLGWYFADNGSFILRYEHGYILCYRLNHFQSLCKCHQKKRNHGDLLIYKNRSIHQHLDVQHFHYRAQLEVFN